MAHANSLANLRPGGGRTPGKPNHLTASIKDMVEKALHKVGGVEYLAEQAHKNPVAFLGLVGRVLPLQVTAGAEGSAIHLHLLAATAMTEKLLAISIETKSEPETINGVVADDATPPLERPKPQE